MFNRETFSWCLLAGLLLAAASGSGLCLASGQWTEDRGPGKLGFDLSGLDDAGLYGPPGGRRALDYELCIPAVSEFREEVAAIDPSARFFSESPGRVGCGPDELLVLGNTHQPGSREVLDRLTALPYVERIVPAWFD